MRMQRWLPVLGVWTAFGLVASAQHHMNIGLSRGVVLPWSMSLSLWMPIAAVWALATPGIQYLGRRFPLAAGRWPAGLAVHASVCAAFVFGLAVAYAWRSEVVLPSPQPVPLIDRAVRLFVAWALTDAVLYSAVLGVGYLGEHQRQLRERELRASRLETELAQAELRALRMQLQPHFLFNALHTIGALVRTGDRAQAIQVVTSLGDLLRRVLDGGAEQLVPLSRELGLIRSYLSIEQVRFRDRLVVDLDVAPEADGALVPPLVLQPLVENAIRHGIEPHPGAGRLAIRAGRANGRLVLTVQDDGAGPATRVAAEAGQGIGLANTRARLARLYGEEGRLRMLDLDGHGHLAEISIPFRAAR